jgi:uncharacterized membrane protein
MLVYPFVVHFTVLSPQLLPIALSLLLALVLFGLIEAIRTHDKLSILTLIAVIAGMVLLMSRGETLHIFYITPVLINVAFFLLFAKSLRPGNIPLITRIATLIRGQLEPQVAHYTRKLTEWWAWFFVIIIVETIALTLYAPMLIWSIFSNFLNYLFIVIFFIVEYHVRIRWLSDVEHLSFLEASRALLKVDFRRL